MVAYSINPVTRIPAIIADTGANVNFRELSVSIAHRVGECYVCNARQRMRTVPNNAVDGMTTKVAKRVRDDE
jgi:hypothetical protein